MIADAMPAFLSASSDRDSRPSAEIIFRTLSASGLEVRASLMIETDLVI
jgi:hypothetical protein